MDERDTIIDDLRRLPGVGPRQAERILSFLLNTEKQWTRSLLERIGSLRERVRTCEECGLRFFPHGEHEPICTLCADSARDSGMIAVIEKETDLRAIEGSGVYHGRYFLLGSTPTLAERSQGTHTGVERLIMRLTALKKQGVLKEVTLALSLTPDGEDTAIFIKERMRHAPELADVTLSTLGRGLSTGSELEYADKETIKNAFAGRR